MDTEQSIAVLMQTPIQRVVFWGLLEACGLYDTAYVSGDAAQFRDGRRSVGVKILQDIHNDEEALKLYRIMQDEQANTQEDEDGRT